MIRVATLNVHGARPRHHPSLIGLLTAQDADIVCLQECPAGFPALLVAALGAPWQAHWAPAAFLGNAVLSRLDLHAPASLALDGSFSEMRSAAVVVLDAPHGPMPVCCTHLDHIDEANRLGQWAELLLLRPDLAGGLICGDLNALTRSDYRDDAWDEIARVRARSLWEPPATMLMDAVAKRGFQDAAEDFPLAGTCRFDTRIDYILIGPDCPLEVEEYDTVDALGATDHSLVAATLSDGG